MRFKGLAVLAVVAAMLGRVEDVAAGPLDPPAGPVSATGPTMIYSLPYTINAPGSYRLGRNLSPLGPSFPGIVVTANDVTIDLNGHVMDGLSAVTSAGAAISSTGTNLTVKNGVIRQWRRSVQCDGLANIEGVVIQTCGRPNVSQPSDIVMSLGAGSRVVDSQFSGQDNHPATLGAGSIVARCTFRSNAERATLFVGDRSVVVECTFEDGAIQAGTGCVVSRCSIKPYNQVSFNFATGITVGRGSTVEMCSVSSGSGPMGMGISGDADCQIVGCTITGSDAIGGGAISASAGSVIRDCRVTMAPSSLSLPFTIGIAAPPNGLVKGCVVQVEGQASTAIKVAGNGTIIEHNTVVGATTGLAVSGSSNLIIRNTARGNGTDYSIGSGNSFGPIVNATGGGDLSVIPGASHPQANFRY